MALYWNSVMDQYGIEDGFVYSKEPRTISSACTYASSGSSSSTSSALLKRASSSSSLTVRVQSMSCKPATWASALHATSVDQFLDLSPQRNGETDAAPESRSPWDNHSMNFEMDFDFSIMGAMDEQLAASPLQAFVDLCWQSTIDEDDDLPLVFTKPLPSLPGLVSSFSSDEESSDEGDLDDTTSTLDGSPVASLPEAETDVEFFVRDHDSRLTWYPVHSQHLPTRSWATFEAPGTISPSIGLTACEPFFSTQTPDSAIGFAPEPRRRVEKPKSKNFFGSMRFPALTT